MSAQFDSGHAKNAANLSKLNQILATFGASYNPVNPKITLASLLILETTADANLATVNTALNDWKLATNNREIEFQDLAKFSTQLLGALESMGVSPQTIDDFKSLVRKMRGTGKQSKTDPNPNPNPNNPPTDEGGISNSQQSFDNKLQHFEKMILLLQSEPLYVPNEPAYTVAKLQLKLTALNTLNTAANNSCAILKSKRISRNTLFYKDATGLLSIIKSVKAYVKALFGATSQQYKALTAVPFFRVIPANKAN